MRARALTAAAIVSVLVTLCTAAESHPIGCYLPVQYSAKYDAAALEAELVSPEHERDTVVFFHTRWCPSCEPAAKKLLTAVGEAAEGRGSCSEAAVVVHVDGDEEPEASLWFRLSVFPSLYFVPRRSLRHSDISLDEDVFPLRDILRLRETRVWYSRYRGAFDSSASIADWLRIAQRAMDDTEGALRVRERTAQEPPLALPEIQLGNLVEEIASKTREALLVLFYRALDEKSHQALREVDTAARSGVASLTTAVLPSLGSSLLSDEDSHRPCNGSRVRAVRLDISEAAVAMAARSFFSVSDVPTILFYGKASTVAQRYYPSDIRVSLVEDFVLYACRTAQLIRVRHQTGAGASAK